VNNNKIHIKMSAQLVIDGNDEYQNSDNIFYMHPSRLGMLRYVKNNSFESAEIKNSPLDCLNSLNLVTVLEKLIPEGTVTVEIDQPIGVMQEYDAKQVEANAKLAGFDNIQIDGTTITFTKPVKGKALTDNQDYSSSATTVTKTTSSTTKGGKTTTTTTTTTQKKRYGKK
jgi:hypothetical protein